jgi:hypothetical protein
VCGVMWQRPVLQGWVVGAMLQLSSWQLVSAVLVLEQIVFLAGAYLCGVQIVAWAR